MKAILQVIDLDPSNNLTGQLTDVSQVEKFELSQEDYDKRTGVWLLYVDDNISSDQSD